MFTENQDYKLYDLGAIKLLLFFDAAGIVESLLLTKTPFDAAFIQSAYGPALPSLKLQLIDM